MFQASNGLFFYVPSPPLQSVLLSAFTLQILGGIIIGLSSLGWIFTPNLVTVVKLSLRLYKSVGRVGRSTSGAQRLHQQPPRAAAAAVILNHMSSVQSHYGRH